MKLTNRGWIMVKNVYFADAKQSIEEFFESEYHGFPAEELARFLNFFYQLSNYEEEGTKIRPNLYITNGINTVIKVIPDCYKIMMYKDADGSRFKQRIKALMCFCHNEWQLYINYSSDNIEYGLIKVLNSIKDKSLGQIVFNSNYSKNLEGKINLININVVSGGLIILNGIKGNRTSICFNLSQQIEFDWETKIQDFVNACCSKVNTRSKRKLDDIKNIYYNIFHKLFKGLHGTICMVVDKDFTDKKGFFSDGTWLKEPIELAKLFLQSKSFKEFKLNGYVDVIMTMLNYDGITIMDNAGRIRAYNVFIETSTKDVKKVVGGARRRAATTLLKYKDKKIVGVYFQSQDGDNFYQDSLNYKKRKYSTLPTDLEFPNNKSEKQNISETKVKKSEDKNIKEDKITDDKTIKDSAIVDNKIEKSDKPSDENSEKDEKVSDKISENKGSEVPKLEKTTDSEAVSSSSETKVGSEKKDA